LAIVDGRRSPNPHHWSIGARSPWIVSALLAPTAFAVLFLRLPETLLRAEFWADDGHLYQDALNFGPQTVFWPYAGTLVLLQRLIVQVEVLVPPTDAPLVGNAVALVATALVAAFLASPRMSGILQDWRWRVLLGLLFVLVPAAARLLGTLSNIQWTTSVYLIAMLVATRPTSTLGRWGDAIGIMVAGLTGPGAILLLPLYALRAWCTPWARWHLFVLAMAALVQVVVYMLALRMPPAGTDFGLVPEVMVIRNVLVPLGGMYGLVRLSGALALGVAALGAVVVAVHALPRPILLGAAYIAIAFPLAGIRATETATVDLLADPVVGERYFFLTGVVLIALIVMALSRRQYWAIPAALILAVGVAADFRIPPAPAVGWSPAAACLGGPSPCSAPVAPSAEWDVRWLANR
jgi:hypothetical protein